MCVFRRFFLAHQKVTLAHDLPGIFFFKSQAKAEFYLKSSSSERHAVITRQVRGLC